MKIIDAGQFGLPKRQEILETGPNQYQLVKKRKSRIIMSDGRKILEQVRQIQNHIPQARVSLATNAPVCSKTTVFLEAQGVKILKMK